MASNNRGKICIWSNDARDMLIDLWSAETIQFALENSKISQETREVYSTLLGSKHSTRVFDFEKQLFALECPVEISHHQSHGECT